MRVSKHILLTVNISVKELRELNEELNKKYDEEYKDNLYVNPQTAELLVVTTDLLDDIEQYVDRDTREVYFNDNDGLIYLNGEPVYEKYVGDPDLLINYLLENKSPEYNDFVADVGYN